MSSEDNTYAPKSPDLSSFFSAPDFAQGQARHLQAPLRGPGAPLRYRQPPPQPRQYHHQFTSNSYQPQPPLQQAVAHQAATAVTTGATPIPQPAGHSYDINQFSQPGGSQRQQHLFPAQEIQLAQQTNPAYHPQLPIAPPPYYSTYTDSVASSGHQRPIPQPSLHIDTRQHQPTSDHAGILHQQQQQHEAMPPRKTAQAAKQPEIMPSPVRTKFPTARIKRIMQADEEVGKVAQQTPIAVGKALELFMVQLVTKSAEVAKDKNSKRITAPMLKQAIDSANEWDFLQDIVAKVTEEKEGAKSAGKTKQESESDDEAEGGEVKKKGRGGRKKKVAA